MIRRRLDRRYGIERRGYRLVALCICDFWLFWYAEGGYPSGEGGRHG